MASDERREDEQCRFDDNDTPLDLLKRRIEQNLICLPQVTTDGKIPQTSHAWCS